MDSGHHFLLASDESAATKLFDDEMVPVSLKSGDKLDYDEQPPSIKPEKIPQLKPAFAKDGSITAANSSAISDGAAALVVMDGQLAQQKGLKPLAIIKGHATHARQPSEFTIAPVHAIEHLLSQLDWDIDEVDLWKSMKPSLS